MFYLGRIDTASGGNTGINNQVTGPSGAIPFRLPKQGAVYLTPDTTGMLWALGGATTFSAGVTRAAPLGAPGGLNGPYAVSGDYPTISVVSPLGGTVKVFGSRTT